MKVVYFCKCTEKKVGDQTINGRSCLFGCPGGEVLLANHFQADQSAVQLQIFEAVALAQLFKINSKTETNLKRFNYNHHNKSKKCVMCSYMISWVFL